MTGNVGGIGEEPIYGKQSCYAGENRQQEIKGHPRCDQQDAVFRDTVKDPQKNVLPSLGRNLRGCIGRSATAGFQSYAIPGPAPLVAGLAPLVASPASLLGPTLAETHGVQQRGKCDRPPGSVLRPAKRNICTQISGAHGRGPCEKWLDQDGLAARATSSICRLSRSSSRLQLQP